MIPEQIKAHTGLRGCAALCVFIYHLHWDTWFPFGFTKLLTCLSSWAGIAVDLFFILSGFILCHVYSNKLIWSQYAASRFARIFPLSIAVCVFCIALDAYSYFRYGIPSENLEWRRIISNILNLQSWYGNAVGNSINPPSWSISVECFLYLATFPLLIIFSKSNRIKWSLILFVGIAGMCAMPIIESFISSNFTPLARGVFGFSIGFSISRLRMLLPNPESKKLNLIGFFSIVLFLCLVMFKQLGSWVIYPLISLLVWFSSYNGTFFSKMLGMPLFEWLGERSYSIYLIHHPLIVFIFRLVLYPYQTSSGYPMQIVFITHLLILFATFILAEFSYRYFELPIRDMIKNIFKIKKTGH